MVKYHRRRFAVQHGDAWPCARKRLCFVGDSFEKCFSLGPSLGGHRLLHAAPLHEFGWRDDMDEVNPGADMGGPQRRETQRDTRFLGAIDHDEIGGRSFHRGKGYAVMPTRQSRRAPDGDPALARTVAAGAIAGERAGAGADTADVTEQFLQQAEALRQSILKKAFEGRLV